MTNIQALILGVVQGITEFLPISSSGHLVITQHLMGLNHVPIHFDVLLHAGTLLAIIFFFQSQIKSALKNLLPQIIIASIPAALFGIIIEIYFIDSLKELWLVSIGLFITAIFLLSTAKLKPQKIYSSLTHKNALIIGFAQALAIIPGVSRSGSTVSTGLHLKIDPQNAFSFSFILSIPAILGALFLQFITIDNHQLIFSSMGIIGFIAALITGLLALKLLQIIINHSKLYLFGIYCLILSIVLFIT